MQFIIVEDHRMPMYVIGNNGVQSELEFEEENPEIIQKSALYNAFTDAERAMMKTHKIAFFFHNFAFHSPEFEFYPKVAENYWPVLSFKKIKKGKTYFFSAGVESRKYPFIGFQFHPEKILYETYMNVELTEYGSLVNRKFISIATNWAKDKKNDTKKKKPVSELPDKFWCLSIFAQEILLFKYLYIYDCKHTIAKKYFQQHHIDVEIDKLIAKP